MRILHVTAAGERGGLEVVLLNVLRCVDRSLFKPEVLLLQDGPFLADVEETATETHVIAVGRVREMHKVTGAIAEIVKLVRSRKIDVVHTWNAKAHIYGGLAAAIARVPSLFHLQGVPKPALSRDGLVSMVAVAIPARRTVACSGYVSHAFTQAWHSRRQVVVIHNGVTPHVALEQAPPSVRREFGMEEGAPIVMMASRLQRWKGVHVFLEAAAQVVESRPGVQFLVVGGALFGLEEQYAVGLRKQVEDLELSDSVHFAGFRSDVSRFYAEADLVVHCSIEPEPFGMVVVEAMDYGKPVIATNIGGPMEIVEAGVTGLLVPPKDASQLAQAILSLLADPVRRTRMGDAGAVRVREHFGAKLMVNKLEELYEGMVEGSSRQ